MSYGIGWRRAWAGSQRHARERIGQPIWKAGIGPQHAHPNPAPDGRPLVQEAYAPCLEGT
jgi:hypothetical protein